MFGILSGFLLTSFGFQLEEQMHIQRLSFPSSLASFPIAFVRKLRTDRSILFYLFGFLGLTRSLDTGFEFTTGCLLAQLFLEVDKSKIMRICMFMEPVNEINIISLSLETLLKHGYLSRDSPPGTRGESEKVPAEKRNGLS